MYIHICRVDIYKGWGINEIVKIPTYNIFTIILSLFLYLQEKDVYGNEVSRLGRPLPVEYLLVDIPASTPLVPSYTFPQRQNNEYFPVENRFLEGYIQDLPALNQYLTKNNRGKDFTEVIFVVVLEITLIKLLDWILRELWLVDGWCWMFPFCLVSVYLHPGPSRTPSFSCECVIDLDTMQLNKKENKNYFNYAQDDDDDNKMMIWW